MTYYIILICVFCAGVVLGIGATATEMLKHEKRKSLPKPKNKVYKVDIETDTQPAFVPQGFIERKLSDAINERIRHLDKQSVTVVRIVKNKETSYHAFSLVVARIPVDDPEYDNKLMRAMAQAEERISTLEVVNDQPARLSMFSD